MLDETTDFIKLFVHHAGDFETPKCFLQWGAVSLIAACVAERSYQFFFKGSKLHPNLYTFLLADSGVGKGVTCNIVTSFLKSKELKVLTGLEESRTTAQGVMDRLAGRFSKPGAVLQFLYGNEPNVGRLAMIETEEEAAFRESAQKHIYLVFEELAASVGSGQRADDFIKFLTKVYGGQGFVDRTRTYGEIDLGEEVCLNVISGSTHRWLKDCVTLDAVLGGFFARCLIVDGDAEVLDRRVWRPKYPWDSDLVRQHLERRVVELTQVAGEFQMTAEADEIGEKWYMERPGPEDPVLGPIFRRERATVLKLAHIFALSEGTFNKPNQPRRAGYKILGKHITRAQEAIRKLSPAIMRVVAHSSTTKDTRGLMELREFITSNQPVAHSACVKYMTSVGIGREQFKSLLYMLRDAGELEPIDGGRFYAVKKSSLRGFAAVKDDDFDGVAGIGRKVGRKDESDDDRDCRSDDSEFEDDGSGDVAEI